MKRHEWLQDLSREHHLALRLALAGASALVERTLNEHDEMRRLAARLNEADTAILERFGELPGAHVRFEERELFEATQALSEPAAPAGGDNSTP